MLSTVKYYNHKRNGIVYPAIIPIEYEAS